MSDVLTTLSLTLIFVLLLGLIRSIKGELVLPFSICISVALVGVAMAIAHPVIDYMSSVASPYSETYLIILFKAIGVSLLTVTCADICRDAGETAIASRVLLIGKCELLALSLPLFRDISTLLTSVMEG